MARFLLRDQLIAFSIAPEASVNSPSVTGSDYAQMRIQQANVFIPDFDFENDSDLVGSGEFGARETRKTYVKPVTITVSGKLNTEAAAILFLRALGGAETDTAVTGSSGAFDATFAMKLASTGLVLPLTSMAMILGGARFVVSSLMVNKFTVSGGGGKTPTWSAELIGTGYYRKLTQSSADAFAAAAVVVTENYMHGAATQFIYNDGSSRDLAGLAREINYTFDITNGVVATPLDGDPFFTTGDVASGAYPRIIEFTKRDVTATAKVFLDENLDEFTTMLNETAITGLKVVTSGKAIGATAARHEFEFKIPSAKIAQLSPDSEGDRAAFRLGFYAKQDSVSKGLATGRARMERTTLATFV